MALLDQSEVSNLPADDWRRVALGELTERLTPPSDFPCTFSQNAFRRELLQFSFVDQAGDAGFAAAMNDLRDYVEACRLWDGKVNSARPLLMIFSDDAAGCQTLDQYHALGWQVLQYWHDNDPSTWPDGVSNEPDSPFWSFCFAGTQLFVNMSAPLHTQRKSRNLGRYFTLVINPRERFDIVAGFTPEGQRVRAKIRARAKAYDGLPHSPLLGSYQKGELEWVQYALAEDNKPALSRCPFQQRR